MSTPDELIVEVSENVLADVDPVAEEGEPHPIWSTMVELGWPHVGLAEPVGGPGGSLADLCALVSATARRGIGVPLLEMSLSCWVLQEPLEDLVVFARSPQWVPWGRCAERLLVVPERGEPHLVDLRAPGVSVRPGSNLAAEPRDAVHVDDRAAVTRASPAFDPELVGARAALLNSAALLGAARGALELTRQHVQQRHQFGKPLLALPPVANSLAEVRAELVAAEAALERAVQVHQQRAEHAPAATAVAKISAARTATAVARTAHQLHGAMGVTREHRLHLVTRRLWAWRDEHGSERSWARWLGSTAERSGEHAVWDVLTSRV